MQSKIFGYIRVSSKDQNEARQLKEMLDYGIDERDIFIDKQSGKDFNREKYLQLKNGILRPGDVLVIKSIDRFGRNYNEILEEWRYIVKTLKVDIVVLDMPLLDTRSNKDIIGTLISDIVLQLLSFVAQKEREFIKQRQAEGIKIAKETGTIFGRPTIIYPEKWEENFIRWQNKEITAKEFYTSSNLKKTTFYNLVKKYKTELKCS